MTPMRRLRDSAALVASTESTVFLLALQSQLVIGGFYGWTAGTSMLIGISQFVMYKGIVGSRWHGAIFTGIGGAVGVTAAMIVFRGVFI